MVFAIPRLMLDWGFVRSYALFLHLLQVALRILLENIYAAWATEVNPFALVVGINVFIDLVTQNRTDRLGLAFLDQSIGGKPGPNQGQGQDQSYHDHNHFFHFSIP
jgi:hypothetical protein